METLFSQILNMSMTASVVIGMVLLVRMLLKRAPKIYSYVLWSVVLFRLLCPVSLSAPVSVLKVTAPQVESRENISVVSYEVVEKAMDDSGGYRESTRQYPEAEKELMQMQPEKKLSLLGIGSIAWLAGLGTMLLYSLVNFLGLKRRLVGAVHWRGEIYLADYVDTPFVLGVFRPVIYLPSDMPMGERRYIVAHERHHVKRMDPLWKLLGYLALCIHWFNPMVWLAFCLAGKDMEMSCDEAVIRRLDPEVRADYAASLLRLTTDRTMVSGMPLAFGEGDTKGRVKNMAKWRKPKLWVSILCVVLCIAVAFVCALNPEEEETLEQMTRWEGPSSCATGDLNYYLPEGCRQECVETMELNDRELKKVLEEKKGIYPYQIIFTADTGTIGGIRSYYVPEDFSGLTVDGIRKLGLMEFDNPTLGWSGGSSVMAEYELEFFTDLPGNEPFAVNTKHYFFLSEDMTMVYDLWFDLLTVNRRVMDTMLNSCAVGGWGHNPVEETTSDNTETIADAQLLTLEEKEAALERCRSVLEQIQSCSRALRCERHSAYDDGIIEYWLHEENWMTIQTHSGDSVIGFMYSDGKYYDNGGMMGDRIGIRDENGNLIWKKSAQRETFHIPWLSQYLWNEAAVIYLGTEERDDEIHIRLCIKEHFPGFEWGNPEYNVTMVFTQDHTFLRAELSVNQGHSSQSEFTEKETIVSLFGEIVAMQMERNAQHIDS